MNGLLRKSICLLLFIGLTACTLIYAQNTGAAKKGPTYIWTKVLDSADWKKSYNFQMFTQHDTAWVFHSDGNWYSTDGRRWVKSSLNNAIYNLGFLDYVQFNNSMYGLGHFEGNIERFTYTPIIYRTNNFKNWSVIAKTGNLPARFFYHPFVFNNKLWIIGGENQNKQYADIWNSADGIVWVKQKDNLPFGKRSQSQILNFKGKLYLLNNDVWTSTDGLNWTILTNEILKGEQLFGYAAVVFDNKIWLLGCNRNGLFSSQVLISDDGKTWVSQTAPWTPRGGIAATVFKGKIYMTGGKYGGTPNHPEFKYSNDLWTLEKK
ncbi:hypothetical protein [Mucilaginibacter sp. UYCu711]|uniref:hypothetical protein n=1 Tax=Mucilaginibacter sp. UYCu711 TaxID=3156339 RepID=UPI003D1D7049